MSVGLLALLDDVAVFAKVAAASLDDVGLQATKAGTKAAALVIDDAAVTPSYVVGFRAQRELPIIWKIATASLRNKILILLPIAVALGHFAPWSITPILMIGGAYLSYEGAEKIFEALFPDKAHEHEKVVVDVTMGSVDMENKTVLGAVRTDFILSAEIMAIALSTVAESKIYEQIIVLFIIAFTLTVAVYGVVAIIVKMDDVGLALAANKWGAGVFNKAGVVVGRGLVKGMPWVLKTLTIVGTAAMTWVGGSIIAHGLHGLGVNAPEGFIHHAAEYATSVVSSGWVPLVGWFTATLFQALFGILIGALMIPLVEYVIVPVAQKFFVRKKPANTPSH